MSFDAPVNLDGTDYTQSDLVRYKVGFSLYWSAGTANVPSYSNVTGAGLEPFGNLILTFNVPTNLGGTDYLPGQLVKWKGGVAFTNYSVDPGWPASSQLRDFGFATPAGETPGSDSPEFR